MLDLVFQSAPVPHLHRFDARVHISLDLVVDGQPLVFQGRAMPTTDLAIQAAAVEAILHLQTNFPHVATRREFCFFPTVSNAVMQPSSISQGDDPTIARVQYITAQGMFNAACRV